MSKKILIMAGGTGGHIFPALAIAIELKSRGAIVEWLGGNKGLEKTLVPQHGFKLNSVYSSGLRRKSLFIILKAVILLGLGFFQTILVFIKFRPDKVIGMGGYASGVGGLVAKIFFAPLIIHEQNTIPGTTNKLLSKFAIKTYQAFEDSFIEDVDATTIGNPILFKSQQKNAPHSIKNLLVLGGSLGAKKINETIAKIHTPLNIWHQTGANHLESTKANYNKSTYISLKIEPFIDDMAAAYAWADIVICRAGAMTISELVESKTLALLVPFPFAVDDHQTKNAEYLSKKGASILINESEFNAAIIDKKLSELSAEKLQEMTKRLELLSVPSPEKIIVDYLLG